MADVRSGRTWHLMSQAFRKKCQNADERCWMCGQAIDYTADSTAHPDAFQPDHFYPTSTHPELALDPGNLRPSHRACNIARGDGPPPLGLGRSSRIW